MIMIIKKKLILLSMIFWLISYSVFLSIPNAIGRKELDYDISIKIYDNLSGKKIVIDTVHGGIFHTQFDFITTNMTSYGASVKVNNETYTFDQTIDVMMYAALNTSLSPDDKDDLKQWFDGGNKTLWISGDSDYSAYFIPTEVNAILDYLGTHVRYDAGSYEDLECNDGAGYRLMANETGDGLIASIVTEGVERVLFHGPTSIIGYNDGLVDLRTTSIDNVEVIMSASEAAIVYDGDLSNTEFDFYVKSSENGSYPMLVVEKIGSSYLIVSGDTTFSDYKNTYGITSMYDNSSTQGSILVDQLLNFCVKGTFDEEPPSIYSSGDLDYLLGETDNEISWIITDDYPADYFIYFSGFEIKTDTWESGENITISADGLAIGTHNFTILAYDLFDNYATNQINVVVTNSAVSELIQFNKVLIPLFFGMIVITRKKK
ncbi:MAG: hypothetical protein ACTSYA_12975 [Candidatus Kariarchaeaceae archaeon]